MKLRINFSVVGLLALFAANLCFAQDTCDECYQRCLAYGCSNPPHFTSSCKEFLEAGACTTCTNHCIFTNCNQPGQACSFSGEGCARTGFLMAETN